MFYIKKIYITAICTIKLYYTLIVFFVSLFCGGFHNLPIAGILTYATDACQDGAEKPKN